MKKILVGSVALLVMCTIAFASALTGPRNTKVAQGNMLSKGVYTNAIIYAGAMVAINSSGYAVPASDASGLTVIGRAEATVDATAKVSGLLEVPVRSGTFYWALSTATSNATIIGQIAYVVDDQTVSISSTGSYAVIAGVVADYDPVSKMAAVDTRNFAAAGASTPASLAVAGAATVGTTLGVSGATSLGSTLGVTGIASFTAVPRLNAAYGTPGTVAALMTNAPAGATADAMWAQINLKGTNYWVPCFKQ